MNRNLVGFCEILLALRQIKQIFSYCNGTCKLKIYVLVKKKWRLKETRQQFIIWTSPYVALFLERRWEQDNNASDIHPTWGNCHRTIPTEIFEKTPSCLKNITIQRLVYSLIKFQTLVHYSQRYFILIENFFMSLMLYVKVIATE